MWFEVDFLKWTKIIRIKTQGRADNFELVQTYTVSYGADRNNFAHVKENGQIKVRKIMINHCNFINCNYNKDDFRLVCTKRSIFCTFELFHSGHIF